MTNNKHQWKLRISAWFDGECSDIDSAEVRSHLLQDNDDRLELKQWRDLRADLHCSSQMRLATSVLRE